MSYELFAKCCRWFLEKGDNESLFCHCFLVLTWCLMCRGRETERIRFEQMLLLPDRLEIFFADKFGQGWKRLYANPQEMRDVCPVTAFRRYTCKNPVSNDGKLFPGNSQLMHFAYGLTGILKEHSDEVWEMGNDPDDYTSESIFRGSFMWRCKQPGANIALLCHQAGWPLPPSVPTYIRYIHDSRYIHR